MKTIILLLFIFVPFFNRAQSPYIDLHHLKENWVAIHQSVTYTLNETNIEKPFIIREDINADNYYQAHHLFLRITNTGNTKDSVYFFCGHWLNFTAFAIKNNIKNPLPVQRIKNSAIDNFIPMLNIAVAPGDSITIEIVPDIRNFNYGYVNPILVKSTAVNDFGYAYYLNSQKGYLVVSFIFLGILLVMLLYAFISYYREKTTDYLFYGIYVLFFIIYFLVRIGTMFITSYSLLAHNLFAIHVFQVGGYIFYAQFLISFIHLKKENIFLYKLLVGLSVFMICFLIIDGCIIYLTKYVNYSILLFTLVRYVLLGISVVSVIALFKHKNRISNYVAYGIFFLFLFGLISLLYTPIVLKGATFHNFFDMRIPWYQLGIFIELVLFSIGLQYKTNMRNKQNIMYAESLKIENEKKEFETFMVVMEAKEKERTRIAQEIHDDIGSGLTSIRLLSEIAKERNKEAPLGEIDKISASASELIENMNEIIWSINSKNDYLANLIAYIRRYVVTYFENMDHIIVKTDIPTTIPNVQITGDFRRAVFLTVKEALHNIVKHADANLVQLSIHVEATKMTIDVKDNGKGFSNSDVRPFSNGLKNMRERMENLGGNFMIISHEGTLVKIQLPI